MAKKKDMKTLLPKMMDTYHKYAGLQFPIYDYNLYEQCREGNDMDKELTGKLRAVIAAYFEGKESGALLDELKELRSIVVEKMEAVSAYTDSFTIYEYILNRMELKFSGEDKPIDDETEARELLQRVFGGGDKSALNVKVQILLSQLPVRMTRAKFLDMIEDSLKLYQGSEQESVEKFLYMLRSAAGIYQPKKKPEFEALAEAEKEFSSASYKTMGETEYMELTDRMQDVVAELNELSDYYTALQEVINQFYVLMLTVDAAEETAKAEAEKLMEISRYIAKQYSENRDDELPDELMELFAYAEGKLERLAEEVAKGKSVQSDLLDYSADELKQDGLEEQFRLLELCAALNSGSLFVGLEEEDNIEPADSAFINEATKLLRAELDKVLESKEMSVKRAVMAAVLKELPIFFSSQKEVMEYVQYSLENCRDYSEKRISLDLLHEALDEFE